MATVWFNGRFMDEAEAVLPATSAAVLYGHGHFETLRLLDGCPCFLSRHTQRLHATAQALGESLDGSLAGDAQAARQAIEALAERRGIVNGVARFARFHRDADHADELLTVSPPRPLRRPFAEGYRLYVPDDLGRRGIFRAGPLSGHKSNNYLGNRLALDHARQLGFDETLLFGPDDAIADAATATLFAVSTDGTLGTPPLAAGALPGIIREVILQGAQALGTAVEERHLNVADILEAPAAFLTNALLPVMPVSHLGRRALASTSNPMVARVREFVEQQAHASASVLSS